MVEFPKGRCVGGPMDGYRWTLEGAPAQIGFPAANYPKVAAVAPAEITNTDYRTSSPVVRQKPPGRACYRERRTSWV